MSASQQVNSETVVALLSEVLGSEMLGDSAIPWEAVLPGQQERVMAAIATDKPPACIVFPETIDLLSQVMALANRERWRVLPMGQGSKLSWGGLAEGIDVVVSTARLTRVVEHAVGDFTVTVEAGMKVADLQQLLAAEGQFLAVDPSFGSEATVGGLVATADTGSLRQRYGGLRDMLIGLQLVRYDGALARAGGRVVKNVAGYDLMKLMTGAYGSLGILSELTFRLYPLAVASRSLILTGGEMAIEKAVAEVRYSGLTPVALDMTLAGLTAELLGEDQDKEQRPFMSLVARFQGIPDGVDEQTERLKKIATTHGLGLQQLEGEPEAGFWRQMSDRVRPDTVLCKVGMRPSSLPALLAQLVPGSCEVKVHSSSGLGWIQWPADVVNFGQVLEKVRSHTQDNGGFVSILQAPAELKQSVDVWGYTGNALKVMSDIKEKFDPHRLLSPGRFVGGL
ncbi:MAG: FAD-binding oxidoreductase [Cyanobacteria bacterium J06576_12]